MKINLYELVFLAATLFIMPVATSWGAALGGVLGGVAGAVVGLGLLALLYRLLKRSAYVSAEEIDQIIREFNAERGLKDTDAWNESDIAAFKERLDADELKGARRTNKRSDKKS